MKATAISTAWMGLSFSTSKKHPSSHSWHCSKALKKPCGSVWPPLLLTRRKEQILQYLWCSFPLTLHLVGPQDGCNECSHKGQVKNTNYTNLSATVSVHTWKGSVNWFQKDQKSHLHVLRIVFTAKNITSCSHILPKNTFFPIIHRLGKPSDCSSFISSSLVAFFSSFVEDSFCGTSKKGGTNQQTHEAGKPPGKMKFPLIIQVRSCFLQEKNEGKRWLVGDAKTAAFSGVWPAASPQEAPHHSNAQGWPNDPFPQNHRDNVAMIERRTSSQVATK